MFGFFWMGAHVTLLRLEIHKKRKELGFLKWVVCWNTTENEKRNLNAQALSFLLWEFGNFCSIMMLGNWLVPWNSQPHGELTKHLNGNWNNHRKMLCTCEVMNRWFWCQAVHYPSNYLPPSTFYPLLITKFICCHEPRLKFFFENLKTFFQTRDNTFFIVDLGREVDSNIWGKRLPMKISLMLEVTVPFWIIDCWDKLVARVIILSLE